ncbi:MAG: alpha-mannosidase [Ignavibacteriae bacterium]|nr:MAG: alpha-mannosidase [Ignavibacteriota bacterium]
MAIDLLEQIHPHVKNSIYPLRIPLQDWRMKEGDIPDAESASLNDRSWTSIRIPFQWGKYDKTYWFRKTITITPEFAGKPLVLLFDYPEALLYLNGKPFHGIDKNHKEILICEKSKLHEQFVVAIQAYSGRRIDHNTFAAAELAVLDTTARRLDSALTVLQDLEKLIDHGSFESKKVRDLIHRTLIFLKYFKPGSEEYPNAIRRAYNFLLNTLETELKTAAPGLVHLIGHSHIDAAWLWTFRETVRKCGRTFSSVLRLMEEFPELKFSQNQPVLYEFTKRNYPELYKQIHQRITEGRWEPLGAMWTEADCNIPGGESLIRQIVFGKRFFKQEFGIESTTLWLPDSFGFTWSLPQILKRSGITNFYTSKLLWNEKTTFPYTSFWWQGIDKTKILAHHSPVGLEGQITPKSLLNNVMPAENNQPSPSTLQTYGFGDGGGGPIKENLEFAVILKTIIGLPPSQLSTVQSFFKQLEEQSANLPVWNNELYLETHRGVYTTNAEIKKLNRVSEGLLYSSELLSTLAFLYGKNSSARRYPKQKLDEAWKKLLLLQFHDIISGTVIADVVKESRQEYREINTICTEIISASLQGVSQPVKKSKSEFHFELFNPLGWRRSEYVELAIKSNDKNISVIDKDGNPIAHQVVDRTKTGQTLLCYVEHIPAFGFKHLMVRNHESVEEAGEPWTATSNKLETPFYRIHLDSKGAFRSIYSKPLRRELFQKGKTGNTIATFRDVPKQWESWNIDAEYEKHRIDLWKTKQCKIIEQGPLRATVRIELKTENGSMLTQHIRFYHRSPRIDFQTSVRWHEKQILMKVAFPFNMKTSSATYEIQFGAIDRSSKPRTDEESAKFEVPAQQWADMSDAKYGVSLLNDCKYGYNAKENSLQLTLLRSARYPNPLDPIRADEEVIDQDEQVFCYSLFPHSGDWTKGGTVQQARELNNSICLFQNLQVQHIPSLLDSSKPNVLIDAVKKAEDSDAIVVRLHEAHGNTTETVLRFALDVAGATECDLLENEEKSHKIIKSKLALKFRPFEIKTLKLAVRPAKKKR